MRLRRKLKVIRFRRYNIILDKVNYYRELLMLHLPWRNEYIQSNNIDFRLVWVITDAYSENNLSISNNPIKVEHCLYCFKYIVDLYKVSMILYMICSKNVTTGTT